MQEILIRALQFVAIIVLGYVLKRVGFFDDNDFRVVSKIVIKITLTGTIVVSFSGVEIDPSMLLLTVLALGSGILYMAVAYIVNIKNGKEQQAFDMLNVSGFNIGTFTLPFVQSFLGPVGVITTSLFDIGNAGICLGGAYGVASIVKEGGRFSIIRILKALSKSVPFVCYLIMITLNLLHIRLPETVISFAQIIANGNAFLAIFMIGIGFKLSGDMSQKSTIARILIVRYGIAALLAVFCYAFLPFALEVRQAVVILLFSPLPAAAPGFTAELKGDAGLASAVNSISIVISTITIVALLMVML